MNFDTLLHKHNETGESVSTNTRPHDCCFHINKKCNILYTTILISSLPLFSRILQNTLLLSDSCLHLFLQSQLSMSKMQACAAGRTHYSVAQAVQCCGLRRFHSEEDLTKDLSMSCDSDSDRYVTLWSLFTLQKFIFFIKNLPVELKVYYIQGSSSFCICFVRQVMYFTGSKRM